MALCRPFLRGERKKISCKSYESVLTLIKQLIKILTEFLEEQLKYF